MRTIISVGLAVGMAISGLATTITVASAAGQTRGIVCKSGEEARRVTLNGKHVWRCRTIGHTGTKMKSPMGGTGGQQKTY